MYYTQNIPVLKEYQFALRQDEEKKKQIQPHHSNEFIRLSAYCAIKAGLIRTVFYKTIFESNSHNRNFSHKNERLKSSIERPFFRPINAIQAQKFAFLWNKFFLAAELVKLFLLDHSALTEMSKQKLLQ